MTLSKAQIKLINSLQQKKYRTQQGLFVAEGVKVVNELLASSFKVEAVFATDSFTADLPSNKLHIVSEVTLKKISSLKTPNKVLGVFKIPKVKTTIQSKGLIVALDAINDPGNLGTIIRLCDWFGVKQLVCSKNTVDCYNQKVVQATMGSLSRVQVNYVDLTSFLNEIQLPVFVTAMNGDNVYTSKLPKEAVLIMGNEANGVSEEIFKAVSNKLTIPRFGNLQQTESLNVATATSILLSEFKRTNYLP